jgi:hypothetical protein
MLRPYSLPERTSRLSLMTVTGKDDEEHRF